MKKVLILLLLIFSSMAVFSSDLIIDSKTQTFSDKEKKIKLDGGVKVKLDNLTVESDRADVTIRRNNKLDTATFYDKPYAYEVNENKKREVKANILKVSLINKVVRAEGEAQSIITEGNTPIVVINADTQEYDINSSVMVCTGGVTMKYKDIDSYSDKAVIIADEKGGLRKIDLIGNARVKQAQNESEGHHFVYNPITEEMSVSGNTKTVALSDDGKKLTIHSDYQQYSKKQNSYIGSGHVKIWYDDYFAQGPKVSVFPDAETDPAPLPAPDIGDNAVGAEVVAAVHDGDPGFQGVVPQLGKTLCDGARLILGIEGALAGGEDLIQKLGELPQMMGGKDTVYMGIAFANPLHYLLLPCHAAAEKNLLLRVAALGVGQRPKIAEHPLLCVFPDGAGVHHHHIRSLGRVLYGVAAFAEQSPDLLGICFILLAAVGLHIGGGNPVLVQPVLADFMTKGKLLLQLLLRNHCGFGIHGKSPFGILTQL